MGPPQFFPLTGMCQVKLLDDTVIVNSLSKEVKEGIAVWMTGEDEFHYESWREDVG
jgi:hypothetical protein